MSTEPTKATVATATPDHLFLTWKNVVVAIFKHETTSEGLALLQTLYDQQAHLYPKGVYMITIVEKGAPMPSNTVRKELADFLATGAGYTRMSAVIQEGGGFTATLVRTVVSGLALLANLPYPHRVFPSLQEGAEWLATNTTRDINAQRLVKIVSEARRADRT